MYIVGVPSEVNTFDEGQVLSFYLLSLVITLLPLLILACLSYIYELASFYYYYYY